MYKYLNNNHYDSKSKCNSARNLRTDSFHDFMASSLSCLWFGMWINCRRLLYNSAVSRASEDVEDFAEGISSLVYFLWPTCDVEKWGSFPFSQPLVNMNKKTQAENWDRKSVV